MKRVGILLAAALSSLCGMGCADGNDSWFAQSVQEDGREFMALKGLEPDSNSPTIKSVNVLPKSVKTNRAEYQIEMREPQKQTRNRFGHVESHGFYAKSAGGVIASGSLTVYPDAISACEVACGLEMQYYSIPAKAVARSYCDVCNGGVAVLMRQGLPGMRRDAGMCSLIFRNVTIRMHSQGKEVEDSELRDIAMALLRLCCPECEGEPQPLDRINRIDRI